jgi:SAM-dependent methyltransferase
VTVSGSLPRLDPNSPTPARIYDYLLGGSHNFAADRAAARDMIAAFPELSRVLTVARAFVRRAVWFLAAEQGITQFLDLGSGIPTVRNMHEIAQAANPAARVAYVDIDPIAVAHARSILRGARQAACVQADLRDPAAVCAQPAVRSMIDFSRPVGVILSSVLHFIPGDDEAADVVGGYLGAAAPGSFLAICHHTSDSHRADEARARDIYSSAVQPLIPRSRAQITALFRGTTLVEPGVVLTPRWRPGPAGPGGAAGELPPYFGYAGVGRKG